MSTICTAMSPSKYTHTHTHTHNTITQTYYDLVSPRRCEGETSTLERHRTLHVQYRCTRIQRLASIRRRRITCGSDSRGVSCIYGIRWQPLMTATRGAYPHSRRSLADHSNGNATPNGDAEISCQGDACTTHSQLTSLYNTWIGVAVVCPGGNSN